MDSESHRQEEMEVDSEEEGEELPVRVNVEQAPRKDPTPRKTTPERRKEHRDKGSLFHSKT